MKKFLPCLLVTIIFLLSICSAYAATSYENVFFTLAGYGIIDGNAPTDECVSRGEFANIAVNLFGMREVADSATPKTVFWDVPDDYIYARDISLLTQIGVLNGMSENLFSPYEDVTYEQAVKVLVLATGYAGVAKQHGGWPEGYVAVAESNRMLEGVSLINPFSRKDLYRLIYNTLDVRVLDEIFTNAPEEKFIKTDDTLRDILSSDCTIYRHQGVITANSYIYTTYPYRDLGDDEVVIENSSVGKTIIYKIGKTNAYDLVGCWVEFYAKETDKGYELLSVKLANGNDIVKVNADDSYKKIGNTISYAKENNKTKKLNLEGGIRVVYNGSRVMSPDDSIFDIKDGWISFVNNDSDSDYDLAMIWEYENAIASSFDGKRFVFVNGALYNSQTSFFHDDEDGTVRMIVTDKNGKTVESFDGERTVSIFADKNKKRYRIIASDEQIEGIFDSISDEAVWINGVEYKTAESLRKDMLLGKNYLLYVNHEGKLAFSKFKNVTNYGYILGFGAGDVLAGNVRAKIILPSTVDNGQVVNEEDTTDTSRVPYLILQNSGAEVFSFAESVKCEGKKYSGEALLTLLGKPEMKVISYELNENGEIKEIAPLEKHGGDLTRRYQYDVYDKVFGGTKVDLSSGFAINSATKAVCVPADDNNNVLSQASDDDLGVKVNITVANNDVGYRVEGYDYDKETKKVRFLVAFASMDASQITNLDIFSTRASMVTDVRNVLNEKTGDVQQYISVLSGSVEKSLTPIQISSENKTILDLKKGDLICYKLNNNDLLENVRIIQSIPDVIGNSEYEYISGNIKKTFGRVGMVEYDEIDTYNKALVTTIDIYIGDDENPREYKIPQKNTPPVYIYDTANRAILSASLKEIRPDNDRVFIFERSGDGFVRALVLIR